MLKPIASLALAALFTLPFGAAEAQTAPKREPTAKQMAARERMSKCSMEWKATKAAGKLEPGAKWPKFWSACNARLKGQNV